VIAVVVAVLAAYTAGAILSALGHSFASAAAGWISASGVAGSTALIASGAAAGFVAGAAMGLLSGASLGQSLVMGLKGAVFGAIGAGVANVIGSSWGSGIAGGAKRALAHGLSRAVINRAQGGKWSAGFWSGLAGSALGGLSNFAKSLGGKMAISAIVGGTASRLGGGKFANGAVSAAFVHMYNYEAHLPKWAPPKSTERTELIPRILNNSVRFILSAGDVIGEAFSGAAHGLHQIMTMDSSQVPGGLIGEGLFGGLTLRMGAGNGSSYGYERNLKPLYVTRQIAYTNPVVLDSTATIASGEMFTFK